MVALGLILGDADGDAGGFRANFRGRWGRLWSGAWSITALYAVGWGPGAGSEADACRPWRSGRCLPMPIRNGWRGLAESGERGDAIFAGGYSACTGDGGGRHRLHGERGERGGRVSDRADHRGRGVVDLVGGLFGGVIQSTPYIGHPAYKAMGARSAYTLATAIFVGAAGIFGFFDWIFFFIPKAVIFPILIFVGLEITAQSFHATPVRHYPAVALACVPALAYLAVLAYKQLLPELKPFVELQPGTQHWIQTVTVLAGGGRLHRHELVVGDGARAHD